MIEFLQVLNFLKIFNLDKECMREVVLSFEKKLITKNVFFFILYPLMDLLRNDSTPVDDSLGLMCNHKYMLL